MELERGGGRMRAARARWDPLFRLDPEAHGSLQSQIRRMIVAAIAERRLMPGDPVPSSRDLSESLGVARNTVVLAYQQLVDEGLIVSRERSGCFVSRDAGEGWAAEAPAGAEPGASARRAPDWSRRLPHDLSGQRNIFKPRHWQRQPYPFVCGQFDPALFPLADWRECSRMALGVTEVRDWAPDHIDGDDPLLVEQLRRRILPRRGIFAAPGEIMITIGAQQALFILAELLVTRNDTVGIEDPGYPDARNIFQRRTARLKPLPLDAQGVILDGIAGCDAVYVTPGHQSPTTATMPAERRVALLRQARALDVLVIEDDYEMETSFAGRPEPALKSGDLDGRVLYVGSLSKTLSPGLRLGYMVAPAPVIGQARLLRRLMVRHPAVNNQRAAALFLSLGHHDALLHRMVHVLKRRAEILDGALERHMPEFRRQGGRGGFSFWLRGPDGLDARELAAEALKEGIVIEPGDVFFIDPTAGRASFRLGFSSIPQERIEPGVDRLARLAALPHRGAGR